jgi:hypothetical protein
MAHHADDYCSRRCLELDTGQAVFVEKTAYQRRKTRELKQQGPEYVDVENTDAMTRRLPGSYGTGKR